jgi:hypothetical protein
MSVPWFFDTQVAVHSHEYHASHLMTMLIISWVGKRGGGDGGGEREPWRSRLVTIPFVSLPVSLPVSPVQRRSTHKLQYLYIVSPPCRVDI